MKILQISTYDVRGGAARAAYRLHSGLLEIGEDSRMLVRFKSSNDSRVFPVASESTSGAFSIGEAIQEYYINSLRTDVSDTLFSFPYPGYDISGLDIVRATDIINLHWVSFFLSPITLHRLFDLGRPVVWTLHDQRPFTGGCHYSAGCAGYRRNCAACPQLADNPFDLPEVFLEDNLKLFRDANLTIVSPSRWMADCARESRLFKGRPIEVIPNSLDTGFYRAIEKKEAKRGLGISNGTVVILFCAESGLERRKGLTELIAALEYCQTKPSFQGLIRNASVKLVCLGNIDDTLVSLGIPVLSPGYMDSDEKIRMVYSASDIFVQSSLEDNFPNTVLEAMSCGIPVVGFRVGGIPEMVTDGDTGILVPTGDVKEMGEAILSLALDARKRKAMGENGSKRALEEFCLARQAGCYDELYQDLHYGHKQHFQRSSNDLAQRPAQTKTLAVKVDISTGDHFKDIFVPILLTTMGELQSALKESEADREARLEQVKDLTGRLKESEADRAERLKQIEELTGQIEESNRDRGLRLDQVKDLTGRLKESEADREARLRQIEELTAWLKESEADRRVRLKVIEDQQTDIEALTAQLVQESQKAQAALEGWKSLEETFAVRYGRKMGLIKAKELDVSESQAENDAENEKESLD